MLPSPALYFTFLAVCAAVLALVSFRTDRILGWIIVLALTVNIGGAVTMGWWAQRVHGRAYTSPDEVAYLWEGERLLLARSTGDTSYVRATVGIFAPINAVVIALAGPGYTPMRVTTALVGTIGVAAAFWLAMLLYGSAATARLATLLCATSPLMILFSWADLRERWIATAALLVLIAAVLTIQRPTWRRTAALIASVCLLTELRHYWGTLLGYLVIAGSLFFGAPRWPRRIGNTAMITVAVGFGLWIVTETFLGIGIRHETVRKYVAVPQAAASATATTSPGAAAAPGVTPPIAAAASAEPGPARPGSARPRQGAAGRPGASMAEIISAAPTAAAPVADPERPPAPYSGPTVGEARLATRPQSFRALLGNLRFVLFGRDKERPDGGQFAYLFLLPEALWAFLLIPLAAAGVVAGIRRGQLAVLIPAAYVGAIMALFTWVHGEEWTTYRFRNLYWPMLLILVAGGLSWTYEWWLAYRRTQGSAPPRTEHAPGAPGAAHT